MSLRLTLYLNIKLTSSISNQTNLALKGMIGIQAMSVIAEQTSHYSDAHNYSKIARDYIEQWQILGINKDASPPHTTLSYGDANSHGEWHFMWISNVVSAIVTNLLRQAFCTTSLLMPSSASTWSPTLSTKCKATFTRLLPMNMAFHLTHATAIQKVSQYQRLSIWTY